MRVVSFFPYLLFTVLSFLPSSAWAGAGRPAEERVPNFSKTGIWLNTEPLNREFFKGKITLVYFWDYASLNCLRDMTFLKAWHQTYQDYGLQMIWIHSPEFEFAKEQQNVAKALRIYSVTNPVYMDNDAELWKAYKIYAWPTKILADQQGTIAASYVGEGHYMEMENAIRKALQVKNPGKELPKPNLTEEPLEYDPDECGPMSAETYLGFKRAHWWGGEVANRNWAMPKETVVFKDRGDRVQRGFFLHGLWKNGEDHFEHARDTKALSDYLGLLYYGSEAYAVIHTTDPLFHPKVYVTRDNMPVPQEKRGVDLKVDDLGTYVLVDTPRNYQLIQNEDEEQHEIKIWTQNKGVSVSSFSFSNVCLSQIKFI